MKLLLADDEPLMLELLKSLMQSLNHEILGTASDGEEAFSLVERFPEAEVLVSDINMPELDGWSLVARMREQGIGLPVILVTGLQNHLYDERVHTLRVLRVISKVDDFMAQLDAALAECEENLSSGPLASH